MHAEAGVFKDFGDLRAKRSVWKGDATSNLTAEGVVEGVTVRALRAVERFVAAHCRSSYAVAKSDGSACLEFPVIQVQSSLFGRCSPAKTITNAATGKESGLFGWGKLKPMFLGMDLIDGVGKLAL